ncbi:MFS transporter [Bordetella petrii]|uniref:MFS transporter n=1 Tax=Bordetella TaxID=517 RepID=UPI00047E0C04
MSATSSSPSPPSSATEFPAAGMLCVVAMLNHIALTGGRITVSLTALQLGLSTFMVGALVAVFAFIPMLMSVRAGQWIDQVGVRRPVVLGNALVVTGTALPFAFHTQWALMLAACGIGVGFMLHQVATQDLLGHAEPQRRLRNFSWLSLALACSGFSGPLLAGLAIDHLGSRPAFGLLALAPLIALAGVRRLLPALRTMDQTMAPPARPVQRRPVTELLKVPPLRRIMVVNTIFSGAWDTHLFVVPLYGVAVGLSATTIGAILASFAVGTFVIRLLLPFIQHRVRAWSLVRGGMAVTAVNFCIYPLFADVAILVTLSFILGLALGSSQPSMLSLLHQYTPPGRAAEAVGLRMAFINASQVSLPLAFGALGAVIGIAPLFWAYALALSAGGWANRHPPQDAEAAPP